MRERLNGPEQRLLLTCFRHPGVPPTNNQAERSLRPVVIMRKVIQGTRSEKALENHSVIRSLFETAKRQVKKPHSFFLGLFTKDTADAQAALYRNPVVTSNQRAILSRNYSVRGCALPQPGPLPKEREDHLPHGIKSTIQ